MGPNYKRPVLDVPGQYRGLAPGLGAGQPFGEMKWQAVFPDEVLQGLIKEALANNYDMRIAASRILEAEGISGSDACQPAACLERNLRSTERTLCGAIPALPLLTLPACS